MAITTLDGIVAGARPAQHIAKAASGTAAVGRPMTTWALAGSPGAGAWNATLNGAVLDSSAGLIAGGIPHFDPASGNAYLARFTGNMSQQGKLLLLDRIWHNGGIGITTLTPQAIVTPTWPARCPTDGVDDTPATTGHGVMLAVEVETVTGAGVPTITIDYTNSDGTAGRSATNIIATVAASVAGSTYFIGLQAGDKGVRSVESFDLSATWTSGVIHLVAYRLIAELELPGAYVGNAIDAVTGAMPRIYNGAVPYVVMVPTVAAAAVFNGSYTETHG